MKRALYLGTDPVNFVRQFPEWEVTHYPVIQIVPRSVHEKEIQSAYADWDKYTHCIFTSKNAVRVVSAHLTELGRPLAGPRMVAIGSVTAQGLVTELVAAEATQEGVIALLQTLDLQGAYLLLPTASRSRPVLRAFLDQAQVSYRACSVYDTLPRAEEPKPAWEGYDQVVFTSPSTVEAFRFIFGRLPLPEQCWAIGPVTKAYI